MTDVLIDTSTIWDLVLYFQQRHRRNRSIASSAAAAIESLLIYDRPLIESSSLTSPNGINDDSRFLRFYCDTDSEAAFKRFRWLADFCGHLETSDEDALQIRDLALRMLTEMLAVIEDPNDLRAYELYDYLPYHLGEDPTAIECQVSDPSVSDLENVTVAGACGNGYLPRVAECLKERLHPTRAAWALPLLRLFHYQAMQATYGVHFVPHATKSTIAFGREAETVVYRRLLDYCVDSVRRNYLGRAQRQLGGLMILVPVPRFAEILLQRVTSWERLASQIATLRSDAAAVAYRNALGQFLKEIELADSLEQNRVQIESAFAILERRCREWSANLRLGLQHRSIRVALSFPPTDGGAKLLLERVQ